MNATKRIKRKFYKFTYHGEIKDSEYEVEEKDLPIFLNGFSEEQRENLSYKEYYHIGRNKEIED